MNEFEKAQSAKILASYGTGDLVKGGQGSGRKQFSVYRKGGSIGENKGQYDHPVHGKHIDSYETEEEAKGFAKRSNERLSEGEKKYYGIKYHVKNNADMSGSPKK